MKRCALLGCLALMAALVPPSSRAALVAHYAFEGSAADSSGNDLHGSLQGNASFAAGRSGFGQAVSLDGTGDYVRVLYDPLLDLGTGGFTISTLFLASALESDQTPLLSRWRGAWDFRIGWDTAGVPNRLFAFVDDDPPLSNAGISVSTGTWHHAALRRDDSLGTLTGTPSMLSIFYDGVRYDLGADGRSASDAALEFHMGKFQNSTARFFEGLIDDVRIYDNSLSDADVVALAVPEPMIGLLGLLGVLSISLRRRREKVAG